MRNLDRQEFTELLQQAGADPHCAALPHSKLIALAQSGPTVSESGHRLSGREMAPERIYRLEQILRHFPQTRFDLSVVARVLNVQKNYSCTVFREVHGRSFKEWEVSIRIALAQERFRLGESSITQVAWAVGYGDMGTFGRNFRAETGMTPTAFLRRMLAERVARNGEIRPEGLMHSARSHGGVPALKRPLAGSRAEAR